MILSDSTLLWAAANFFPTLSCCLLPSSLPAEVWRWGESDAGSFSWDLANKGSLQLQSKPAAQNSLPPSLHCPCSNFVTKISLHTDALCAIKCAGITPPINTCAKRIICMVTQGLFWLCSSRGTVIFHYPSIS